MTVRFGSELHFDDLIQAHERKFGPLWKYNASVDDDEHSSDAAADNDFHDHWDSKPVIPKPFRFRLIHSNTLLII